MKSISPISWFPACIAAFAVVVMVSAPADARPIRTYGGGGYTYRPPNVDAQFARWHRYGIIPSLRDRRPQTPIAAPFSIDGDSSAGGNASARRAISQREAIKMAQRSLRGLGYYRGLDNGTMSRPFEQALRRFQADSGARNTGVVNLETLEALGLRVQAVAR